MTEKPLVSSQPNAETTSTEPSDSNTQTNERQSRNQITLAVELAKSTGAEFFHTPDKEAYASIPVEERLETWSLKSQQFKLWLQHLVYKKHGRMLSDQSLEGVLNALTGAAFFDGKKHQVHLRVAEHEGAYYLDLADEKWSVVKITDTGWEVLETSPVKFWRTKNMTALPVPTKGGSVNTLREFINVRDQDWALILAWIMAALRPKGPYPLLVLHGEQGSAKSTTAKIIRSLVDPNTSSLRTSSPTERDLFTSAVNNRVLVFDNLSTIPVWMSDALCSLSTGGAYTLRKLYSDHEEVVLEVQCPVILTGISELLTRPDLMSRAILLNLPLINGKNRRTEEEVLNGFKSKTPEILGALLTAMSSALGRHPGVTLTEMPRLADFLTWAVAAEGALGLAPGTMVEAYASNVEATTALAVETSVLINPIIQLVENSGGEIELEAAPLLEALKTIVGPEWYKTPGFPRAANTFSYQLKREAPELRRLGIDHKVIQTSGSNSRKIHRLSKIPSDVMATETKEQGDTSVELKGLNTPTQATQINATSELSDGGGDSVGQSVPFTYDPANPHLT